MNFSSLLLRPCCPKAEAWIQTDSFKAAYLEELGLPRELSSAISKWQSLCRIHFRSDPEGMHEQAKKLGEAIFEHFGRKLPLVIELPSLEDSATNEKLVWPINS